MLQKVSSFFFGESVVQTPQPTEETPRQLPEPNDRLEALPSEEGKEDRPTVLQETDMNDEWIMVDFVPRHRAGGSPCREEWREEEEEEESEGDLKASCWLMEPPPCFLMPGRPEEVAISPRENLLIEHPSLYGHWGNWYYHRHPEHLARLLDRLRRQRNTSSVTASPPTPSERHHPPTVTLVATSNGTTSRCTLTVTSRSSRTLTEVQKDRETAPAAQQARWQREQQRLKSQFAEAQNRGYQKTAKRPHRKDRRWRRLAGANNNRCSYLRL